MISDAKILIAAAPRSLRHCFKRVCSVRAVRMRMKDSRDIGIRHKLGQTALQGADDFIPSLSQLRRHGLHAERFVDRLFGCRSHYFPAVTQALFIEDQLPLGSERAKARNM